MMPLLFSLATPSALIWGLLALPLILLFLLRQKRKELRIGSTLLWRRAVQDRRASSPLRRPSNWLSLLLLLLALSFLVLGLAGLRLGGSKGSGRPLVLVLDVSASMTTASGDGSRFDAARRAAERALGGLEANDPVTLIAAGPLPSPLLRASRDHQLGLRLLRELRAEAGPSDLRAALELAGSEARQLPGTRILLFSDLAFDATVFDELPALPLEVIRCGEPATSAGLVELHAAGDPEEASLLATVVRRGPKDAPRTLLLERNGELLDARELPVGARVSVAFRFPPPPAGESAPFRLRLDPPDAFALDDELEFGIRTRPPPHLLLIGPPSPFLADLDRVFPGAVVESVSAEELDAWSPRDPRPLDLVIVTKAPETWSLAPRRELWIGCLPPGMPSKGRRQEPALLDWDRAHPSLSGANFDNLLVYESLAVDLPEGAEALVRVNGGPQLLLVPDGERQRYLWTSTLIESNLPLLPAFPILLRNLMAEALGGVRCDLQPASRPLRLPFGLDRLEGECELTSFDPDGEERKTRGPARSLDLRPGLPECGLHLFRARSLQDSAEVQRHHGVGLLDDAESLTPMHLEPLEIGGEAEAVTDAPQFSVEQPRWRLLAFLALALLLAESALFGRRGPRLF